MYEELRANSKHNRICANPECNEVKAISYIPRPGQLCKKCSSKERGKNLVDYRYKTEYVRYWYFCPNCPTINLITVKRKTSYCGKCSRKESKRVNPFTCYYDYDTNSYIGNGGFKREAKAPRKKYSIVCPDCGGIRGTTNVTYAGIRLCKDCKPKKVVTVVVKKATSVSPAIRAEQEKNKRHRAAHMSASTKTKTQSKKVQFKSDEELKAEWLDKNKVTIIEPLYIKQKGQTSCSTSLGDM